MRKLLILLLLISLPAWLFAQSEKLHTVFIYNFTKHIEWPEKYRNGDFIIGVLGNSPITGELEALAATRKVGGQNMRIENYKNPDDIRQCHILYIPESQSGDIAAVLEVLKNKSTLIVTDKKGMARSGAAINFVVEGSKQKFELNKSNATKYGLKVSSDLERLAVIVD